MPIQYNRVKNPDSREISSSNKSLLECPYTQRGTVLIKEERDNIYPNLLAKELKCL